MRDDIETMRLAVVTAGDANADMPPGMYGRAGTVVAAALSDRRVVLATPGAQAIIWSVDEAGQASTALLGAMGYPITQIGKAPR